MPQIILLDANGRPIGRPVSPSAFIRPPGPGDVINVTGAPAGRMAVIAAEHAWLRSATGSDPVLHLHMRPYTADTAASDDHVVIPFAPAPQGDDFVPFP